MATAKPDSKLQGLECNMKTTLPEKGGEDLKTSFDQMSLLDKATLDKATLDKATLDKATLDKTTMDKATLDTAVVKDAKWKQEGKFRNDGINKVKYFDVCFLQPDKIAAADYKGKRIEMYNTNGNPEGVIPLDNSPYRVEATTNRQLVVSDNYGGRTATAKVYTIMDGELAFDFTTVDPDDNAATAIKGLTLKNYKPIIIVGGTNRNVLTEHRLDGFLLRTISVKTTPWYLAVDSNDRVVISGYNQCVVDVVDGDGEALFTITPTIKDREVKYCRGVCCDGTDIYIAMKAAVVNTGHIHRYDGNGIFHSCVVEGLYTPGGISMSNDGHHMAVADYSYVILYGKV